MQKLIKLMCAVTILCVYSLQSASWCDSFNQWLEQEVPENQAASQHHALMRTYASPQRSEQPEMPGAASRYVTENLAAMLNGSRSEQLQASSYLQEAIDKNTLTPETGLLAVQHAKLLGIPRDEQIEMLSTLLDNNDSIIQIKALRVAEKEMLAADLKSVCCCAAGITLSGIAAWMYGPFAAMMSALSTVATLRDPVSTSSRLQKKISVVKTTLLAKEKTE